MTLYDVCFLTYEVRQTSFCHCGPFFVILSHLGSFWTKLSSVRIESNKTNKQLGEIENTTKF